MPQASERKFQAELNEPRIAKGARHHPEVGRHLSRIRCGKLRVVEQVEDLRAELQVHPFARPEGRSLKDGKVEVLNVILPKR